MTTLNDYHRNMGMTISEGYCDQVPQQINDLKKILKNRVNLSIMEIGFNGGHSSDLFLSEHPSFLVTSFDIGHHAYMNTGKNFIDKTYPNRHTLVVGNSIETIPKYIKENPNKKFDVIFIDGGHDLFNAESDLFNCIELSHSDTVLIMDDTIMIPEWNMSWNTGPTLAWLRAINNGVIVPYSYHNYLSGRGMSVGTISKH